jgi:hypothetical protein
MLVIGDVVGHNVSAAAAMGQIRTLLLASDIAIFCGVYPQGTALAGLAALPIAVWEIALGVRLVVKGFRPSPLLLRPQVGAAPTAGPCSRRCARARLPRCRCPVRNLGQARYEPTMSTNPRTPRSSPTGAAAGRTALSRCAPPSGTALTPVFRSGTPGCFV